MKIHKGYTFRIYPTEEQRILIHKTLGCCRYVWNWALGNQKKKDVYWYIAEEMMQNGQLPENRWKSDFFQESNEQKELTKSKKELGWLKEALNYLLILYKDIKFYKIIKIPFLQKGSA